MRSQIRSEIHTPVVGNIPLADLQLTLNVLDEQEDELVKGYKGSPFSRKIKVALLLQGLKLFNIKPYDGKMDHRITLIA